MKKILIASHGKMADGIKNSLQILLGMGDAVETISAYTEGDNTNYELVIKQFIENVNSDDEAIIFTDIEGGSINQMVLRNIDKNKNIFVITGTNLPIVMTILLENEPLTKQLINELIGETLTKISELELENDEDLLDEDAFF